MVLVRQLLHLQVRTDDRQVAVAITTLIRNMLGLMVCYLNSFYLPLILPPRFEMKFVVLY